jgi:glycosyltransferase involved in cell wall biosynthesis
MKGKLHLALAQGDNFGWGVCSHYIEQELRRLDVPIEVVDGNTPAFVDGTVFHALANRDFESLHSTRGSRNIGYTFFENELTEQSTINAAQYDLVLAGSSWCYKKMLDHGIPNCGILIQGVDPLRFHPRPHEKEGNLFIVFSGGKFELRKGQDLVLSAFRKIQQKYSDIILMNMWYNFWPETLAMFQHSRHIMFSPYGNSWDEFMNHLYRINGLDATRIVTLGGIDNVNLATVYAKTDLGVFPNRCEGGTNLVLMEYMACGKPVIASNTSGHKDILNSANSLLLDRLTPYPIYDAQKKLWGDWEEPSVDQLVEQIEYAYHHRSEMARLGQQAGEDMQHFTWTDTAKSLLRHVERIERKASASRSSQINTHRCPICASPANVLDTVDFNKSCEEQNGVTMPPSGRPVQYYLCNNCEFCFAAELCDWSIKQFADNIYNDEYATFDPDYIDVRPRLNAENIVLMLGKQKSRINHLDYGGGNGLLSRLLLEQNFNSTSYDPFVNDQAFKQSLGKFNLITAFEVFEHVPSVHSLMSDLKSLLADDGLILFSTVLSDGHIQPSKRLTWWYAAPRNGHISLFSRKSLATLASQEHFELASCTDGFHALWRTLPSWAHHLIKQQERPS